MSEDEEPVAARLLTRAQARAAGLTDRQIDRRLAGGTFTAARRGVLQLPAEDDSAGGQERKLTGPTAATLPLDVGAALLASPSRELIISHASAARLWGGHRAYDGN
jgi:hypothetical protein